MSSTLAVNLTLLQRTVETFTGPDVDPSDNTLTYTDGSVQPLKLNAATTPAVSSRAGFTQAMTSGAASVHLTAMPGKTGDETVDFTGLAVQTVVITAPAGNGAAVTLTPSGTHPYALFGASFSLTLAPGQQVALNCAAGSASVTSSVDSLAMAGTGTDSLTFSLTAGLNAP